MHQFFTKGRQYIILSALFEEYKYLLYAKKIQILNSRWYNFWFQVGVQKSWNVSVPFSYNFLFLSSRNGHQKFATNDVNWKWPENGCLQQRRCNKPFWRLFFKSIPIFGHDVHWLIRYQWARFSKVPKLFGRISGDVILFVSSKRRRLEARNFALILLFPLQHKKRPALQKKLFFSLTLTLTLTLNPNPKPHHPYVTIRPQATGEKRVWRESSSG